MSANNTSGPLNPKKNLKRTNRLQQDNMNPNTFDNAGFEDDCRDDVSPARKEGVASNPLAPYEQGEQRIKHKENQITTYRRLPNIDNPKLLVSTKGMNNSSIGSNQNVLEPESIELKVKDSNLKQQESRKASEGTANVDASLNNKVDESSEENDTVPPIADNERLSNTPFMNNLKRFTGMTKSNGQAKGLLKMSRTSMTVDLDRGMPGNDAVDGTNFTRSFSMRVGGQRQKPRPRLLRDLSLSDADDSIIKDYGSLKDINLPRRHGNEPISVDTLAILESLMRELIKRGKVYHVAVLDREESDVMASVPSGLLTKSDAIGMVKSIECQPSLFKLRIGKVDYSCFKHRIDAVQGRAPDIVAVMQMTDTCVVAGFSRDDAPGSCNSEVHEFTKALEEAGW